MVASRFNIDMPPSRIASFLPPPRDQNSWYRSYTRMAWDGLNADVYIAFIGSDRLQLSGFLVTEKSDINRLIAHCPVAHDPEDQKRSYRGIHEQLLVARKIAANPACVEELENVLALGRLVQMGRAIPRWIYALACIPLSYSTSGNFLYPTPFCPSFLSALEAAQ